MLAQFISGPLHEQVLEVGSDPPDRWIAPSVPRDRNREPQFRPIVSKYDDLSAPRKYDLNEYESRIDGDRVTYLLKTVHRADGTKLELS